MNINSIKRMIALIMTFALVVSIGYKPGYVNADAASKVSINKKSVALKIVQNGNKKTCGSFKLKVNKAKKVTVKKTTYKVADKSIASVDKKGKITAKKMGATTVTALVKYRFKKKTYQKTFKCNVKVTYQYKNVIKDLALIHPVFATCVNGAEGIKPAYKSDVKLADDFYLWDCLKIKIKDTSVAKLGESGFVLGLKPGTTDVTVSTTDGSKLTVTGIIKVYEKSSDIPANDDLYGTQYNSVVSALEAGWTEEDKVRYVDENGIVRWSYATEAENIYKDNLNKLIEQLKTKVTTKDNTSEDVIVSLLSTAEVMRDGKHDEAFLKEVSSSVATPIINTKSVKDLIELCKESAYNGISMIVDTSEYEYITDNLDYAESVLDKKVKASDEIVDIKTNYYPVISISEVFDTKRDSDSLGKLKEYIKSVFKMLYINDDQLVDDTVNLISKTESEGYSFKKDILTAKELEGEYPNLDLYGILKDKGYKIDDSTPVYISGGKTLKSFDNVIASGDCLNGLKGLAILTSVTNFLSYTRPGSELNYRYMMGDDIDKLSAKDIEEEVTRRVNVLYDDICSLAPYDLDHVYTDTYYSDTYKPNFEKLAQAFADEYKVAIADSWMSEKAKKNMLKKVNQMKFNSLYPTDEEYKLLCVKDDLKTANEGGTLAGNLKYVFKTQADLLRMTVCEDVKKYTWWAPGGRLSDGPKPWDLNAFYDPYVDEAYFCHKYLVNSYVDNPTDSKDINVMNLGYLAVTIGHEIGHAFDNNGSCFNADGDIENLWTDDDYNVYQNKCNKLANVYDTMIGYVDLAHNKAFYQKGNAVVNEAMADLGGTEIGLRIVKKLYPNDDEAVRNFFKYSAKQWVSTEEHDMSGDNYIYRLDNEHPMYRLRANGVPSMIDDYYKVFDVKETDGMYVAPDKRVTLWD